jgi:hypothetical protein
MAPRNGQGLDLGSDATDTVFENLGVEGSDFETDDNEVELDDDTDEGDVGDDGDDYGDDDDSDPFAVRDGDIEPDPQDRRDDKRQQQLDNLRVSHTDQNRRRIPKRAEVKPDKNGNLVNAEGQIVARAGREARYYQGQNRAKHELSNVRDQLQDTGGRLTKAVQIARNLLQENERYKAHEEKMKEFKFAPEDQISALQLYADLRKDTAGTLRRLLTKAAASGINLNAGGASGGGNNGVDTKSLMDTIREEITKAIQPVQQMTQEQKAQKEQQDQQQRAFQTFDREVRTFFGQNPQAKKYLPVFKRLLSDPATSNMSLDHMWARIQLNLDRSRSKGQRNGTPLRGRSLPSGRGAPPANAGSDMAPINASYDAILKDVLDKAG